MQADLISPYFFICSHVWALADSEMWYSKSIYFVQV